MVRYLKDLALYSIPPIHVSDKYPINYSPLNFAGNGKMSDLDSPIFRLTQMDFTGFFGAKYPQ